MRTAGYLLVALAAAACLTTVHPLPTEAEETAGDPRSAGDFIKSAGRFGFATLDALAQRVNSWLEPARKVFMDTVQNKTVSEVAIEARNATVNFATRVQEMEAFQSAKEAISPLRNMFVQVRDSIKDKTLQQLAEDVQQQVQKLDKSLADFIRGYGDRDDVTQASNDELEPAAPAPAEEIP